MQIKTLLFVLASTFTGFTVALPEYYPPSTVTKTVTVSSPAPTEVSQCNTGSVQCCNSVESANSPSSSNLLGLLGVVVQGVDVLVGLGCTPISVVGILSGTDCNSQPVCCEDDTFQGLINIGCSSLSL